MERINQVSNSIKKIDEKAFTNEELMKIINLKKEEKLKNKERNMNITHELAGLQEQYNAAYQKYTETNDEKTKKEFEEKLKDIKPKLEILTKIAAEREEEDFKKSEVDKIAYINKRNKEKQNVIDIQNSLLNRKKQREKVVNQYRRKDCAPVNLFDSGYLKKDEKEKDAKKNEEDNNNNNDIKNDNNIEKKPSHGIKLDEQKSYFFKKAELLKNLNEFILNKGNEINEIFEERKRIIMENKDLNNNNKNNFEKILDAASSASAAYGSASATATASVPISIPASISVIAYDENSFILNKPHFTEDVLLDLINFNNSKISVNSKKLSLSDIEI
jgi:hypothetical protein